MARRNLRTGCLGLFGVLTLIVAGGIGFVAWQGGQTPSGTPEYVALGSSYAAGAGLGPAQAGSPLVCARSTGGYPPRLERLVGLQRVDMSCGGAVTANLIRGGQVFQGPQLRVVDQRTRLVTITAGGNDIGYVGDLSLLAARRDQTVMGWAARHLWKGPRPAADRDYDALRRDLVATVQEVRRRAPQATVVMATYPTVLPARGTCARIALSEAEAELMRDVGDHLAETTRQAARESGAVLVDMHLLGAGHDACSAEPWISGWRDAGIATFHPTAAGAQATAEAIAAALPVLHDPA